MHQRAKMLSITFHLGYDMTLELSILILSCFGGSLLLILTTLSNDSQNFPLK